MDVQQYFTQLLLDIGQLENLLTQNTIDIRLLEECAIKTEDHCNTVAVFISVCEQVDVQAIPALNKIYEIIWALYNAIESKLDDDDLMRFPRFNINLVYSESKGRPSYDITCDQVVFLRNLGMSWSAISNLLGVSRSTLYRRKNHWGADIIEANQKAISDEELVELIKEILSQTPNSGEVYILGSLRARNVRVARWRVRECLKIVDPLGRTLRRRSTIHRRKYQVKGTNFLWHIDSNHKLISFKLVYHGCIDGYSRTIIYLECLTNNKAANVLKLFQNGTQEFGIPSRVRGDRGVENIHVAQFMLNARGIDRGSFIVGRSVHNQRIERLWAEVNRVVTRHFKDLFLFMEHNNYLDEHSDIDIFCLHYVYLPRIQKCLGEFVVQWNYHGLSSVQSMSPYQLWTISHLQGTHYAAPLEDDNYIENPCVYGVDEMGPPPEIITNNNVVVPEVELSLSEALMESISLTVLDPLSDDGVCGISYYLKIRQILIDNL